MKFALKGRVNNTHLPISKPLLPLFEAIANSLDSIEEAGALPGSFIKIGVDREEEMDMGQKPLGRVLGFRVYDNGIGFIEDNFNSFETSDSLLKQQRGGKGLGRLLWLKAFSSVRVESVYREKGQWYHRTFGFRLSDDGIHDSELKNLTGEQERSTCITLDGYLNPYSSQCPKKLDTLAEKIIEHCLMYLLRDDCPQIFISDDTDEIDLKKYMQEKLVTGGETDIVNLKGQKFTLKHFRIYEVERNLHRVHFCAHNREVSQYTIPQVPKVIPDESGKDFVYIGYLSSPYLDNNVDNQRVRFTIEDTPTLDFPDRPSKQEIEDIIDSRVFKYLEESLVPLREKNHQRIVEYISRQAPKYRALLNHCQNELRQIQPGLTDRELELALHKINRDFEMRIRVDTDALLNADIDIVGKDEYQTKYSALLVKCSDIGKSNLAEYIVHRRTMLDLLEKRISMGEEGSFDRENAVHSVIFPLKKTSNEINFSDHNLWMVDERLSYHSFLASDVPLDQQTEQIEVPSRHRPDIIVYNRPLAFVEDERPFSSVVIIEFKRPGRNDYTKDDNPINQIYGYIEDLQTGRCRDNKGQLVQLKNGVPFFGYVISDITPKILEFCKKGDLKPTPDERGYFGYNSNYNAYIEVISYNKLIDDTKKRNRVLFDKLFSPTVC